MRRELKFEKRTVAVDGRSSSIAMEALFWNGLEKIATRNDRPWREQAAIALEKKPAKFSSRAGWLRIWVFAHTLKPHLRSMRRL